MQKTIISVKNLQKSYGNFEAVKGISFEVSEGEIFGLLGPNGAGKSTTLEIIETLREKTSGEITVDGLNLDKQPDEIKKIINNVKNFINIIIFLKYIEKYSILKFIYIKNQNNAYQ
jgi:ABC-2 type transport system ATP-binding protein